ncbi:MAG TPA: hypothetical protein P5121_23140 [Caldilineaceae bacterium]|nr:hypothetical protein [Caldilineaceae bacterium]
MSLPIHHLHETYTAARATPDWVGWHDILPEIWSAIHQTQSSAIVYVTGAGGVGKTRLISHILASAAAKEELLVADRLIDLYHTRNRSVGGLAESIVEVLKPLRDYIRTRPKDSEIDEKLEALARAEHEGLSTAEVITRRRELSSLLMAVINQYSAQRRLILALDTAERLYVVRDEAQETLGLSDQRPAVLDWLLHEFLPNLHNAVVLISGRPRPLNLTDDLQRVAFGAQQQFVPIELAGLTRVETLAYFDSIVARAEQSDNPADKIVAESITQWRQDEKETIFACLYDKGTDEPRIRPILLALAIDHLVVSGYPLPALVRPLDEARKLSNDQRRQIEEELGKALVQTLREHQRPADEVIITLGWLRKGADIDLLQKLTDYSSEEITRIIRHVKDLSFVKIRPADERIFLHDEMYDILHRYALERTTPPESRRIFELLQMHYAQQISEARNLIDALYQPQADSFAETLPDPNQVRETRARLHDAMVEDLYYRLRWRPLAAFEQYFLYAEEAILGNDENLWAMLRAELFGFLAEEHPLVSTEEIERLRKAYVIPDSAVRWVEWLFSRERYAEAVQVAEQLKTKHQWLIQDGGDLAAWHLDAWHGFLYDYLGRYDDAETLLTTTVRNLKQWRQDNEPTSYSDGILARAYNSIGYHYSRRTQHYLAIRAFGRAVQLVQELGLYVDEANTLNNRAFDIAKIGDFAAAIPSAKAGLRLREQLGPRTPVGLSLNTLGLIELSQFDSEGGLRDIRRAVETFRNVGSVRGVGLALIAYAEALRRISVSIIYVEQRRAATIMADALAQANEAIEIFKRQVDEPPRLMEAWREQARIYRDWAKLRLERPAIIAQSESEGGKFTVEELVRHSQLAFEQANALVQHETITQIELLYDQALLLYYVGLYPGAPNYAETEAQLESVYIREMNRLIPVEYHELPGSDNKLPRVWYLVQRGNIELLSGHLAFKRWSISQSDKEKLSRAVEHYDKALTYYTYFSRHDFQEKRQALDELYEQLRPLTFGQKYGIYQHVCALESSSKQNEQGLLLRRFLENRFGDFEHDESIF